MFSVTDEFNHGASAGLIDALYAIIDKLGGIHKILYVPVQFHAAHLLSDSYEVIDIWMTEGPLIEISQHGLIQILLTDDICQLI